MVEADISRLARVAFVAALTLLPPPASAQPPSADTGGPRLTLQALRETYAERDGRFARIDGLEVYFKDQGSGPAILMVHGSVSSLRTWDGVAAVLKAHYRVIRYDVPGQGLSGPVSDEAAAKLQPADIAEGLLAQLGVSHATVVGVSSGGTLGVYLAARRPDLVDRLILSNTPADPVVTTHMEVSPELQAQEAEAKKAGFQSMGFWNAFLDFFSGTPSRITPAVREQYYDMNRRIPEKNAIGLVAKVADHQKAVEAMAGVRAPTLLVWGARDALLPPRAADTLAGYLTGAQVSKVLMPDVGHYPPLEVPERFAKVVADYIEAVTPGAAAAGPATPR